MFRRALFIAWPAAQVIVGNPPFQAKNKMQAEFGAAYVRRLRARYPEVSGLADYCVYWFRRAHDALPAGGRAGLVGTNTIRQNYSRGGSLDYILANPAAEESVTAGRLIAMNRDGTAEAWPVIERGTPALPLVSKDFVHYATQENYDNWYFGQSGREEGLSTKIFNVRPSVPLPAAFGQIGVSGLANTSWTAGTTLAVAEPNLGFLTRNAFHASMWLTAFHDQPTADLSKYSTGEYLYPDTSNNNLAGFSKAAQSQVRWAAVYKRVSQWAAMAATLSNSSSATSEDADLDGENEHLLFNDRVFAMFERIGGRMTCAFVRDLSTGRVLQVVGNPHSYSGFETEEEGAVNVINGAVGSLYHTRVRRESQVVVGAEV